MKNMLFEKKSRMGRATIESLTSIPALINYPVKRGLVQPIGHPQL
jgi:hypothetical protein